MIYDLENNLIGPTIMDINSGSSVLFPVLIDCFANKSLRCDNVNGLTINARRTGTIPWINIETSPLSLTPWAGQKVEFEVQIISPVTTINAIHEFKIEIY